MNPYKHISIPNQQQAHEIISELKKLRNDFIFAWVGDDILRVALEEKIEELDIKEYFKLLGIRSDIPEILNCSDAFLMPSLFEGMPISMVEAQCCGCKCFVSDRVTKMADMTDGLYLPITDPKRWAMEIDAYLSSNIEKKYPSKDMLLKFTSEFMADEISKAYLS